MSRNAAQSDSTSRREHERIDTAIEVSVHSDSNFWVGWSENVSEGGLFVATSQPINVGEAIRVTFKLPGIEKTLEATCQVRWLRVPDAWSGQLPGMGLQFLGLDEETLALVTRFVQKRAPIFFDDE